SRPSSSGSMPAPALWPGIWNCTARRAAWRSSPVKSGVAAWRLVACVVPKVAPGPVIRDIVVPPVWRRRISGLFYHSERRGARELGLYRLDGVLGAQRGLSRKWIWDSPGRMTHGWVTLPTDRPTRGSICSVRDPFLGQPP